jgi:hypothetical protein
LKFFPIWTSEFAGFEYTLPWSFELPLTPVIPIIPGEELGTYFLGFTILHPDSNPSDLVFYSDFSIESDSIALFNIK